MTEFNLMDIKETNFLDMLSTDMNFEQAYNKYSTLQQKQATNAIEHLQSMQALNQQYMNEFSQQPNQFDFHRQAIIDGNYSSSDESEEEQKPEEIDEFFSNSESNALEKFLDNLATNNSNPFEFYNQSYQHGNLSEFNNELFDLHTMKPSIEEDKKESSIHDLLKKEITEAFSHPQLKSLSKFEEQRQLPTPLDSRQSLAVGFKPPQLSIISPPTSSDNEEQQQQPTKKRRRSSTKPLLTLEQKRLNHSNSEQKRRQLCKLAYDRCLRLITNVEDYKNHKVSACPISKSKKKLKRRQLNKDGLPNLSKHTALVKISEEILKIKSKNDGLKKLLN